MAASRTAAQTVPEELKRQSERITEQLAKLNIILDTTVDHLSRMSTMMDNYSPELVAQINKLRTSLTDYKGKAGNIYGDMSQSLATYAYNLIHNLDNLTGSVGQIVNSVQDL